MPLEEPPTEDPQKALQDMVEAERKRREAAEATGNRTLRLAHQSRNIGMTGGLFTQSALARGDQ
jgi:hypothetical protein